MIKRYDLWQDTDDHGTFGVMDEEVGGQWVRFEDHDAIMALALDIIARLFAGYPCETIPRAEYEETEEMVEAFLAKFARD